MFGLEADDDSYTPTLSQIQDAMAVKAANGDPLAATAYADLMNAETKRMEWLAWSSSRTPRAEPEHAAAAAEPEAHPIIVPEALATVEIPAHANGSAIGDKSFADRVAESQKSAPNGAALE
jgi:hypothetical protein